MNEIINAVVALATIGILIVSIWQIIKTLRWNEDSRTEDFYFEMRRKALQTSVWIAIRDKDSADTIRERVVIISNCSENPIYDVSLTVDWGGDKDKQIPGAGKGSYRIIPAGMWVIRHASTAYRYDWCFPEMIPEERFEEYPPEFMETTDHSIRRFSFADSYGNKWCYIGGSGDDSGLHLLETEITRFKKYREEIK